MANSDVISIRCQSSTMKRRAAKATKRIRKLYLAEHRKVAGKSQEDIAKELKKDVNTIARWEQGGILLSENTLAQYAESVGVEPEDLYHPPGGANLNALVRDQSKDVKEQAVRLIKALRKQP